MKIGLIGKGFVGTALFEGMKHTFQVVAYDKASGWHYSSGELPDKPEEDICFGLLEITDGPIFVCLPTPMLADGSCDVSLVERVVRGLNSTNAGKPIRTVAIKSTVVPGTTERLNAECKWLHVCFNPEFLREATAVEDFKNQDRIIIGGPHEGTAVLKHVYNHAFPDVPVTKTSSTIAEMVKYVTNCFLAVKVSFANEMKQICDGLEIDYDKIIEYATKDLRLGSSHWSVPGPMPSSDGSGKYLPGFSGSCLCKDINALINKSRELGIDPKMMIAAWAKNLEVRPERDWEYLMGRVISKEQ